jgi:hypothetical protein
MHDVRDLLESEREAERRFVSEAAAEAPHPTGWPAALLMFHVASWRQQLRDALIQASRGETIPAPPSDVDAFNAAALAKGASVPLTDAASGAERLLDDLIDLWATIGERPFPWYIARTTGEALVRNSYLHPRNHISEHFVERADRDRRYRLYEETAAALRKAEAPGHTLGAALYNLACARVGQRRLDEALHLLEEAMPMRDDLRATAAKDRDLEPLRDDPRFQAML